MILSLYLSFLISPRAARNYPLTVFDLSHIISACSGGTLKLIILIKASFALSVSGVVEAITQEAEKSCPNLMTSSYLSLFGGITPPPWDNTWAAGQADKENLLIISGRNLINNFLNHIQPALPGEPPGTSGTRGPRVTF